MATVETTTPEARAIAKWVRIAPRKARLVTEHIRGRTVPEARTILAFTPRAAAREVEKVLRSAVANAEANHGLIGDELVVSTALVDEGVTMKRWRAQARGRAHRIRKRTCHITIKLTPLDAEAAPAVQPEAPPPAEREEQAPEPEAQAETVVEETTTEEPEAEEKPKRGRKRSAEPVAEGETETKPRRRSRRKSDEDEEGDG
jgi:large subunit ribosomal protein L22